MPGSVPVAQPVTTAVVTTNVGKAEAAAAIVENLTRGSAAVTAKTPVESIRGGLFEDDPIAVQKIPGALHLADNEHIERLIARHGAVGLVRQIAEDLATRDLQMSVARRRAEERERALRRICRESGLSNLELENRLKVVEADMRSLDANKRQQSESALSNMMNEAMDSEVISPDSKDQATIRAASGPVAAAGASVATGSSKDNHTAAKGTAKGWKDYIWGAGPKKAGSPAQTARKTPRVSERRPLQDDLFNPPVDSPTEETTPAALASHLRSASQSSNASANTTQSEASKKTSLASFALRLVVGSARDPDSPRGRTRSAASNLAAQHNTAKARPSPAAKALSKQLVTKGSVGSLNSTASGTTRRGVAVVGGSRSGLPERWDTMRNSPPGNSGADPVIAAENYGPVEMDTILPPDGQPPTLTHIYNRYAIKENLLTDRFGFIYDQRRKKRQREAAKLAQEMTKGGKKAKEMLTNNNSRVSAGPSSDDFEGSEAGSTRPGSPGDSILDDSASGKSGWQDYLKIATFPTELLAHTPSMSGPAMEVTVGEDRERERGAKSPTAEAGDNGVRGFTPMAGTVTMGPVGAGEGEEEQG